MATTKIHRTKNLLPEFAALFGKYQNEKGDPAIKFKDWVVNLTDLDALGEQLTTETRLLQGRFCQQLKAELANNYDKKISDLTEKVQALLSKVNELENDPDSKTQGPLKTPKSMEELAALNALFQLVNRRNARLRQQGKDVDVWGDDGQFSTIFNEESLVEWLKSGHAKGYELTPEVLEHFKVFIYLGELVTLSRNFKGGIGIEVLWVPLDHLKKTVEKSDRWASIKHRRNDPRREYEFHGGAWDPKTYYKKTLKRKTCE